MTVNDTATCFRKIALMGLLMLGLGSHLLAQTDDVNRMEAYEYWFGADAAASQQAERTRVDLDLPQIRTTIETEIDTDGLPTGTHVLNIRFLDTRGQWSIPARFAFLKIHDPGAAITGYRYWFNDEATHGGNARIREVSVDPPQEMYTLDLPGLSTESLAAGPHRIHVQFRDAAGNWSVVQTHRFHKNPVACKVPTVLHRQAQAAPRITACAGTPVRLDAVVDADQPTFRWYRAGSAEVLHTGAQYQTTAPGTYIVEATYRVSNQTCVSRSESVRIQTRTRPAVTVSNETGASNLGCSGDLKLLRANVFPPSTDYSYQWYRDGQPLPGETRNYVRATQTGNYSVQVSTEAEEQTCPPTLAAPVRLSFRNRPSFEVQTREVSQAGGTDGQIRVFPDQAGVTTQYRLSGPSAPGATAWQSSPLFGGSSGLEIPAGRYEVEVSDGFCTATKVANVREPYHCDAYGSPYGPGQIGPNIYFEEAESCSAITLSTDHIDEGEIFWLRENKIVARNTEQFSVTASGRYRVVIRTPDCPLSASEFRTFTVHPAPEIETIVRAASAPGKANGEIEVRGLGGTLPYLYQLESPARSFRGGTARFSALATGMYRLSVVDAEGCQAQATASVPVGACAPIPFDAPDVLTRCEGTPAPRLEIQAGPEATYQWFFNGAPLKGATQARFNATVPGRYQVAVSRPGCPVYRTPTTTLQEAPNPELQLLTQPAATGDDGQLTALASGGAAPYSYRLVGATDFQAQPGFIGLAVGRYQVEVRDALGCGTVQAATITGSGPCLPPSDLRINSLSGRTVTVSWLPVLNATSYEATFTPIDGDTGPPRTYYVGNSHAALINPVPGARYEVRIRAFCGSTDQLSAAGAPLRFRVPHSAFRGTTAEMASDAVQIVPNPNSGTFRIWLNLDQDEVVHFHLLDATGRSVWKLVRNLEAGQQHPQFTLPDALPAGLYHLKIQTDQGGESLRMLLRP